MLAIPLVILYSITVWLGGAPIWIAILAAPLIWLSVTDLELHVIPDTATLAVAICGLAHPILVGHSPSIVTVLVALTVIGMLALLGEIYWRHHGVEALGLGDVKLIGAGTLVVGAEKLWIVILLSTSGGIVAALLAQRRGDRGIPFGPFLAYAIFSVAAFAGTGISE